MFDKVINIKIDPDYTRVLDNDILKTASESILPAGHRFDPDFVYVLIRSVSAGEYWGPNNNMDFFEEEELKQNYNSFKTDSKVYKNHENKAVEKALGDVVSAEWDDSMKCVPLVIRIDKTLAPEITRGILKKTITDVSMGCRVDHVICSYCGKRAKTRKDYCEHLLDSSLRGKVMPNGVQVYEINKGPKFHDISIVTKGADGTAKMYVVVDGEAASKEDTLKKVASLNFEERIAGHNLTKKFIPVYPIDPYYDLGFKKTASAQMPIMKLAEIDKIIKGNIMAILNAEQTEEAASGMDEVFDTIKLFYTKYWDDETIDELVSKIEAIAKKNAKSSREIFKTFLRTAELAGIELTPMEFSKISARLSKDDISDIEEVSNATANMVNPTGMKMIIKNYRDVESDRHGMFSDSNPLLEGHIFESMLAPFMRDRSFRPSELGPRMMRIANDDHYPMSNNLSQFVLPFARKTPSSKGSIMIIKMASDYDCYQNDRTALYSDENFDKYASLISNDGIKALFKEAGALTYAALTIPTVYGYSAYQRAKMLNGEPLNGPNRYVAENPGNAALMAVLAPVLKRKLKARAGRDLTQAGDFIGSNASKLNNKAKSKYGDISDFLAQNKKYNSKVVLDKNLIDPSMFNKMASETFFSNSNIDKSMKSAGYTDNQLYATKLAMADYFVDNEYNSAEILKKANLNDDASIDLYLKIAKEFITIELEKMASDVLEKLSGDGSDIAKDTFADTLFYQRGAGAGSLLPGSILDGFIFNKITKGLEKKVKAVDPMANAAKTMDQSKKLEEGIKG